MADGRLRQGKVAHLLREGYLTELFSEKGKQAYEEQAGVP